MIPDGAMMINCGDTSAASVARRLFRETGRKTSPYASRPERESYTEWEDYAVPGVEQVMRRTRTTHRWGAVCSSGDWSELFPMVPT